MLLLTEYNHNNISYYKSFFIISVLILLGVKSLKGLNLPICVDLFKNHNLKILHS